LAPHSPLIHARCEGFLQSLTADERAQLTSFAQRRLVHFGLPANRDEDLYQQALYVVLKGIAGQGGRNPGHEDVKTKDTFRNYIRGVINSIAEGWARTHHRNGHCSLDLIQDIVAAKEAAQVEYQDLIAQLFTRLRQRAPARLLPTIDAWERSPDGRIPCVTTRKHVCAVRRLARQIAIDLGLAPAPERQPDKLRMAPQVHHGDGV